MDCCRQSGKSKKSFKSAVQTAAIGIAAETPQRAVDCERAGEELQRKARAAGIALISNYSAISPILRK